MEQNQENIEQIEQIVVHPRFIKLVDKEIHTFTNRKGFATRYTLVAPQTRKQTRLQIQRGQRFAA